MKNVDLGIAQNGCPSISREITRVSFFVTVDETATLIRENIVSARTLSQFVVAVVEAERFLLRHSQEQILWLLPNNQSDDSFDTIHPFIQVERSVA
jgi:hypothetical protein